MEGRIFVQGLFAQGALLLECRILLQGLFARGPQLLGGRIFMQGFSTGHFEGPPK